MMRPGSFLSRAAALLLFIAACAAVFLALVDPLVRQGRFYDETLATLRDQRTRFAAATAALPELRAGLAAIRERPGPRNAYIGGDTASRAAAALLEIVTAAIESSGATLISKQDMTTGTPGAEPEQAMKVAVRAQMKATPEALQRVFHRLEAGRPTLFIGDVAITGRHLKKTVRGRKKQEESWEELLLDVRFLVTGFRRVRASAKAPQ